MHDAKMTEFPSVNMLYHNSHPFLRDLYAFDLRFFVRVSTFSIRSVARSTSGVFPADSTGRNPFVKFGLVLTLSA